MALSILAVNYKIFTKKKKKPVREKLFLKEMIMRMIITIVTSSYNGKIHFTRPNATM